jgi:hypothetical protein
MPEYDHEPVPITPPPTARGEWELSLERLRAQHPDASDGILFCVYKLQQDPDLTLRDFRDEANLRGIPLSGRSLHSAKVLMGVEKPSVRRKKEKPMPAPRAEVRQAPEPKLRRRARRAEPSMDVESSLIAAVRSIQDAAGADAQRLRDAIQQAVDILQQALDAE